MLERIGNRGVVKRLLVALGAGDPEGEAARRKLQEELLSQVRNVPVSQLETRIEEQVGRLKTVSSLRPIIRSPRSKSELKREAKRRERKIRRLLGS